jgi:NAD kinase
VEEEDCVKGGKTNFSTSFEFEEADKTITELGNEAVRVRSRHRYEATIKAGVSEVYSEHLKWIALAKYTIE